MAEVFTDVTGKEVAYVSPSQEQTLELLLSTGWPEWQAKGMWNCLKCLQPIKQ
jgi:NAD(P)H dehydrogenase (quinone)